MTSRKTDNVILTPYKFIAKSPYNHHSLFTRNETSILIRDYFLYRVEWVQNKRNRFAECIILLKSVDLLLKNKEINSATLLLKNFDFHTQELLSRIKYSIDHESYKPPLYLLNFIKAVTDPLKICNYKEPIVNLDLTYITINDSCCPVVILDSDLSVICPFCNERHIHSLKQKFTKFHSHPQAHFHLPCINNMLHPIEMFDGTICYPEDGYFISNYDTLKFNSN